MLCNNIYAIVLRVFTHFFMYIYTLVHFRTQTVSAARAEAEKIRLLGEAEAHALEAIGISEAERMRMKAMVYKKYGEAAILNITLNALPKVGRLFRRKVV